MFELEEKIRLCNRIDRKTILLMVTYKCNLNCTYCYEKFKSDKEITFNKAQEIITNAFEQVAKEGHFKEIELSFMGGNRYYNIH